MDMIGYTLRRLAAFGAAAILVWGVAQQDHANTAIGDAPSVVAYADTHVCGHHVCGH